MPAYLLIYLHYYVALILQFWMCILFFIGPIYLRFNSARIAINANYTALHYAMQYSFLKKRLKYCAGAISGTKFYHLR